MTKKKQNAINERAARVEALRAQQARHQRHRRLAVGGSIGALVLALATGGAWALQQQGPAGAAGSPGTTAANASGVSIQAAVATPITYTGLSRGHVKGAVIYAQIPPAGGDHATAWVNCGVYDAPVPKEAAVHSLEHGAIWITYSPDLPSDQVTALRAALKNQPYGLLSPYSGLPSPIVATVWGTQLRLQSAADPQLRAFIAKYADAATAPEPRGECTGGVGTPIR